MSHDWIRAVIEDLIDYAVQNDLPAIEVAMRRAQAVAAEELEADADMDFVERMLRQANAAAGLHSTP